MISDLLHNLTHNPGIIYYVHSIEPPGIYNESIKRHFLSVVEKKDAIMKRVTDLVITADTHLS